MLWRALRDVENGYYIDVGAHDPERNSVTRAFYERGWSGINIEPVGAHFEQLQRVRTRDVNLRLVLTATTGEHEFFEIPDSGLSTLDSGVATRHRMSGKSVVAAQVRARLLRDVWSDFVKRDVHFLKIDVEGGELEVLAGADFVRQRPWIVVVEATAPLTRIPTHQKWEHFLAAADYLFAYFDGLNRYYVASERSSLVPALVGPPGRTDDFVRAAELVARNPDLPAAARFDSALHLFLGLTDPEPTLSHPTSQLCTASQFREPEYRHWCEIFGEPPVLHRKQWEHVFLLEALDQHGVLKAGRCGLGLGCGREPIAAAAAARSCEIVATDLDTSSAQGKGWVETSQRPSSLEDLNERGIAIQSCFANR
ncbi:MAG TPA: FkbM family methyltransferase [Casimicrobiaceae bacterium]|nr:FkbM family methyltransferase [Casimicrobiaceae bacterium]